MQNSCPAVGTNVKASELPAEKVQKRFTKYKIISKCNNKRYLPL